MQQPLTPEQYQQLLDLGGENSDLATQMQMQMAQAKALRPEAPQMRQVGNVARAPHWMELIGGLAQAKTSNDLNAAAMATGKKQTANRGTQNNLIMQGLFKGNGDQTDGGGFNGLLSPKPRGPFSFGGS